MAARRTRSHATRRPPGSSKGHGLAWFIVGTFVGGGVMWTVLGRDPTAEELRATVERTVGHTLGVESIATPPKPKFEFYTLLPEMEVVVPDEDLPAPKPAPTESSSTDEDDATNERSTTNEEDLTEPPSTNDEEDAQKKTETAPKSGHYVLQIASLRSMQEADGLKAQLILLGFSPVVQSVAINSDEKWYRVRIGPYADRDALGAARARLRVNGHDNPLVVWVKKG